MDVLEIKQYLEENYSFSTLHDCSEDDSKSQFLVQNRAIQVFDFDEIKVNEVKQRCFPSYTSLTSPDTLFFDKNNHLKLIEFKNSYSSDVKKPAVRIKCYEALILLKTRFDFKEYDKITYILVDKGPKSNRRPSTHAFLGGRCPRELKILKQEFPNLEVECYQSKEFDKRCYSILNVPTDSWKKASDRTDL